LGGPKAQVWPKLLKPSEILFLPKLLGQIIYPIMPIEWTVKVELFSPFLLHLFGNF